MAGILEGFGREAYDFAGSEHVGAPGFQAGGAPEETVFVGLDSEGIESEVSGEADGASAVESCQGLGGCRMAGFRWQADCGCDVVGVESLVEGIDEFGAMMQGDFERV